MIGGEGDKGGCEIAFVLCVIVFFNFIGDIVDNIFFPRYYSFILLIFFDSEGLVICKLCVRASMFDPFSKPIKILFGHF